MPFKPHVADLKPYVAQPPVERLQSELGVDKIYKLASNEGAFGPVPAALEALTANLDDLRRYPDSAAPQLREKIASLNGLAADNVVLGNGADELIRLAAMTVLETGDNGIFPWPSFPTYVAACATTGAEARPINLTEDWQVDFDALRAAIYPTTRIVFISNPNNPTGLLAPRAELRQFIVDLPDHVLCVLDEAYAEYAEGDEEPEDLSWSAKARRTCSCSELSARSTASQDYGLAMASERPTWCPR